MPLYKMRVSINIQNGKFEKSIRHDFIERDFMLDIKDVSLDSGRVARAACESRARTMKVSKEDDGKYTPTILSLTCSFYRHHPNL